MATLLETVNRFRKIEEATAPKDDPAPVYLLDEIADMARQSPESAQAIADAVQKKLGVKSPVVKFKALRIIKHLCVKGCSQFQRCMQRHSSSVRELIHFRGEPDPFKGDVPNARVREFAKDVVEVMFNATPVTNTSSNTLAAQGKIQGFGSAGPESSSTYSGIGSSGSGNYGGMRNSSSSGRSSSAASGLPTSFAAAQQAASQLTHAAQQALGEGPIAAGIASAANALGGFLQPAGYGSRLNDSGYRDGSDSFGYSNAASYTAPTVSVTPSQVLGSEEGLVDGITAPGGLRALPDAADLRRFVDTASSMDGLRIAELLREKMESPRWQVVLRAVAALEAVLQRGSTQACGEVAVMFQSDPEPVRSCLKSPQQQVQQRAAAVLKLLLGEEVDIPAAAGAGSGSAKKAAAAKAAPVVDMLIDDSPAEAAAPASASASGIDLLGDFADPVPASVAAPPAAASADSLFDGLGVSSVPAAPAAAGAAGGDDLFGGLTVAAPVASAAALAAAAPAPAASKQSAPLDELFSGLATNGNAAASSSSVLGSGLGGFPAAGMQPAAGRPVQQQQQQPAVQMQLMAGLSVQQDLLGDFSAMGGPGKQQAGFGVQHMQVNSLQQQQQQQQYSMPGMQQQWAGMPGHAGVSGMLPGSAMHQQQQHGALHGMPGHGHTGSTGGAAGAGSAWSGHDDVSNLLRQVGHGGKYDPAFDFVADEFKKH